MTRAAKPLPFVRFAVEVLRLTLTRPWRVLLTVSIDGVEPNRLDGEDREVGRTLFGSDVETIPPSARKILVWRLGRGSGKSTLAGALALWALWCGDLSMCGTGTLPAAVVVSPTKPISAIAVRIGRELVRNSALEKYVVRKTDSAESFCLRRPDGRLVQFKCVAASRGGARLRGYDIVALILDESEFFESNEEAAGDGFAVSDRDQLAGAMPRLLGFAILVSTPWPSANVTSETFDRNFGDPRDALVALGTSVFMRPDDQRLARDVEREKIRDAENAAREYECDPGARGGKRIFVEGLAEAVDPDRPLVVRAAPGSFLGCGGDLALERDWSAIAFTSMREGLFTLLEYDEIKPAKGAPLSPGYVIKSRFAPLMNAHGAHAVMMDNHYRQSAIEHLRPLGLTFVDAPTGASGKYDSFMFVRGLIRAGMFRLPNAPKLLAQFRAVTATPMPGGGTRITSPRRAGQGHGDAISAIVASVWAARQGIVSKARRIRTARTLFQMGQWFEGRANDPEVDEVFDSATGDVVTHGELRYRLQQRRVDAVPEQDRMRALRGECFGREAELWNLKCGLNADGSPVVREEYKYDDEPKEH